MIKTTTTKERLIAELIRQIEKLGYKISESDNVKYHSYINSGKSIVGVIFRDGQVSASDAVDIEDSANCSINSAVENAKKYIVAYENAEELELEGLRTGYRKIIEHNNYILAMKEMEQGNGYEFVTWMYSHDKKGVTIGRYFNDYESAKENMALRSGLIDRNKMFNETELKLIHTNLINYVVMNPNIEYKAEEAIGSVLDKIENIIPEILARDELEELELVDDDGLEL
ncbi:MAG: hypothetical protein ACLKAK_11880 [Alkaliphilus sp.]